MKLFHRCKHNWKLTKEIYKAPAFDSLKEVGMTKLKGMPWLFNDKTTLIFQCSICKKIRIEEAEGKSK